MKATLMVMCLVFALFILATSLPGQLTSAEQAQATFTCQTVDYLLEPEGVNHWQTPVESLFLRTGDCEDKAILFISRLRELRPSNVPELILLTYPDRSAGHAVVCYKGWYIDVTYGIPIYRRSVVGTIAWRGSWYDIEREFKRQRENF